MDSIGVCSQDWLSYIPADNLPAGRGYKRTRDNSHHYQLDAPMRLGILTRDKPVFSLLRYRENLEREFRALGVEVIPILVDIESCKKIVLLQTDVGATRRVAPT